MCAPSFPVIPIDGSPRADDTTAARQHRAAGLVYRLAAILFLFGTRPQAVGRVKGIKH